MDSIALLLSIALPWCAGCALLVAARWPFESSSNGRAPGSIALVVGYGYFVGLLVMTAWMRLLSATGAGFGRFSIAAPLLVIAALMAHRIRKPVPMARIGAFAIAVVQPPLPRWQRIAWAALLAGLSLRFATLAVEIATRPLYPWDAWTQWATKARVWYELGRIVPFVQADAWFAGGSGAYFDASPANPGTVPLLQAWSAIALGRWDDSATNWPWLFMLGALALSIYGMLRGHVGPLAALTGAYLVASLPLLDTHVALAGYPDVMLAGTYTLSALALHRWASGRDWRDGVLAVALGLACPLIEISGRVWLLTLLAGAVVAVAPRAGLKLAAWGFAAAALALLVLSRSTPMFSGLGLHLDYLSPWPSLADAYFLFDNWHLLWYAATVVAIVGARRLLRPTVAPLTVVAAAALASLVVASMFSNDFASWFPDARVVNRATVHVAPLIVFLCTLLWRELTVSEAEPVVPAVTARDAALVTDA